MDEEKEEEFINEGRVTFINNEDPEEVREELNPNCTPREEL